MISKLRSRLQTNQAAKETVRKLYFTSPSLYRTLAKVLFSGRRNYCPVCESKLRSFQSVGVPPRPNSLCPVCLSRERHRLLWIFLEWKTDLLGSQSKRLLHVAPEKLLADRLRSIDGLDYLSADLDPRKAMVKMDITDIQYDNESFDIIICNHVLEHIPDDLRAMREFHKVLTHHGFAVFTVPMTSEETFEDEAVTEPAERERLFGQRDHLRRYGPDFEERLRRAGFAVRPYRARDVVNEKDMSYFGVLTYTAEKDSGSGCTVFFCTKA